MSRDNRCASANAAREIAQFFGLIADTLDWHHPEWLALMAHLQATGKAAHALTLADVQAAVAKVQPATGVHGESSR